MHCWTNCTHVDKRGHNMHAKRLSHELFYQDSLPMKKCWCFQLRKYFPKRNGKKKQTQVWTVAVYDLNMIYFILLNGRINYSDTHDFKLLAISSPLLHCIHLSFLTFFESFNLSNLEKMIIFTGQTISYFQNFHSW